jgi:hypothetical protein
MKLLGLHLLFGAALALQGAAGVSAIPAEQDDSVVRRTSCGHGSIENAYRNLSGPIADELEKLQARFEGHPGFRAAIYDGLSTAIVVDGERMTEWDALMGRELRIAKSCVPETLIVATMAAVTGLELGDADFATSAYDALEDAVLVATTLLPHLVSDAIGKELDGNSGLESVASSVKAGTLRITQASPGSSSRMGRNDDSEPFRGGSRIRLGDAVCSTGFTLGGTAWGTVEVTAGHCGTNGTSVWNGQSSNLVGTLRGRSLPNPDLAVIAGKNYVAKSYSAYNLTSSKNISGSANPATGVSYCQMGAISWRVCTSYDALNAAFCDDSGCTNNLAYAEQGCSTQSGDLARPGDSGGGVYRELSGGTLNVRGLVVAAGRLSPTVCARWDHKVQTIVNHYGAFVVTQ